MTLYFHILVQQFTFLVPRYQSFDWGASRLLQRILINTLVANERHLEDKSRMKITTP
jgi:hypothetical protein